MEPRMTLEPKLNTRMFVRAIVVHDQMQVKLTWSLPINLLKKSDKLLRPMPWHTIHNDLPIKHVQGCKKCRGPIAFVIMGHGGRTPLFQRQSWWDPVQSLNLTLFIYAHHQCLIRRIQRKTYNILKLLNRMLVPAEFERLDQMGLEMMLLSDATNGGLAETLCFGHRPGAPVDSVRRLKMQGCLDYRPDLLRREFWFTTRTGSILLQPSKTQSQKPLSPKLNGRPRYTQSLSNVLIQDPISCHDDNPGSNHFSIGEISTTGPCIQRGAFSWIQYNRSRCSAHASHYIKI